MMDYLKKHCLFDAFQGMPNTYDRDLESCFTTFHAFHAIQLFKYEIYFL